MAQLHLHSPSPLVSFRYRYSIQKLPAAGTSVEVRVEKKIKKDLTGIITWDIKGVLTRKTKG